MIFLIEKFLAWGWFQFFLCLFADEKIQWIACVNKIRSISLIDGERSQSKKLL